MKKLLIALLLVIIPGISFAQAQEVPVGSCMQLKGSSGYWQKLSDFSWAPPGDQYNTCAYFGSGGNYPNGPLGNYNPQLGRMSYEEWLRRCFFTMSFAPRPECQGYNPFLAGNIGDLIGGIFNYPRMGRATANNPSGGYPGYTGYPGYQGYPGYGNSGYWNYPAGGTPTNTSNNSWTNALIGIGLGWVFNRLTT